MAQRACRISPQMERPIPSQLMSQWLRAQPLFPFSDCWRLGPLLSHTHFWSPGVSCSPPLGPSGLQSSSFNQGVGGQWRKWRGGFATPLTADPSAKIHPFSASPFDTQRKMHHSPQAGWPRHPPRSDTNENERGDDWAMATSQPCPQWWSCHHLTQWQKTSAKESRTHRRAHKWPPQGAARTVSSPSWSGSKLSMFRRSALWSQGIYFTLFMEFVALPLLCRGCSPKKKTSKKQTPGYKAITLHELPVLPMLHCKSTSVPLQPLSKLFGSNNLVISHLHSCYLLFSGLLFHLSFLASDTPLPKPFIFLIALISVNTSPSSPVCRSWSAPTSGTSVLSMPSKPAMAWPPCLIFLLIFQHSKGIKFSAKVCDFDSSSSTISAVRRSPAPFNVSTHALLLSLRPRTLSPQISHVIPWHDPFSSGSISAWHLLPPQISTMSPLFRLINPSTLWKQNYPPSPLPHWNNAKVCKTKTVEHIHLHFSVRIPHAVWRHFAKGSDVRCEMHGHTSYGEQWLWAGSLLPWS